MTNLRKLADLNVSGRKVIVRSDLNVPLNDDGEITDDNRIRQTVPTIKSILDQGGIPIVCSHLGRPKGMRVPTLSLAPVAKRLGELLSVPVKFSNRAVGEEAEALAKNLASGEVLLLENLRFEPGEKKGDKTFALQLARLGDMYVGDAFATAHREDASMVALAELFEERGAGLLLQKEIEYYEKALVSPKAPLVVVLGGAKVSSKLPTIINLAQKADSIIIGGAMANTFLAAQGVQMGRSLYEPELFPKVLEIMGTLARRSCNLYLPVDFRLGTTPKGNAVTKPVTAQEVPAEMMALDIGPATSLLFAEALERAETIVWNGPMGAFENEEFSEGTFNLTRALASAHGLTVVGGGDTDAAIHALELEHKFDYISTGGGAFLELLEGKELPGVKVLSK